MDPKKYKLTRKYINYCNMKKLTKNHFPLKI
jgi:hypothetical protein